MAVSKKINSFFKNPQSLYIKILQFISPLLKDEPYISLLFRYRAKYKLNLANPQTFNEKLQWLKLYYRKPELTQLLDKHEVKDYLAKQIGGEFVIPTLGVWEAFEEIDFTVLPKKFVLKTTHDQGGVVICTDKSKFNYFQAKKKLTKHLKRNFY